MKYLKTMFVLTLGGVLFSGYLSAVKLFTSTCAFNESCPYFFGYPSCWYGFALFFILFVATLYGFLHKKSLQKVARVHAIVSGIGILFAGYFTFPEISSIVSGTSSYTLGVPTCAYGLVFYVIVFILSLRYLKNRKSLNVENTSLNGM